MDSNEGNTSNELEPMNLEFFIQEFDGMTHMKNISLVSLPKFHGMYSKYLDNLQFDFDFLC